MSDALERIKAQVEARRAAVAAPPPPPAPAPMPPAPAPSDGGPDLAQQVQDLQESVAELAQRLSVVEDACAQDAMEDLGDYVTPDAMMASVPHVAAVTKSEGDAGDFPASDYAYVPDPESPSTWKLRLTATPGGEPDAAMVGAAAAALGPGGFRGNQVEISAADKDAVVAKVRAAWEKANPDKKPTDMPESIAA